MPRVCPLRDPYTPSFLFRQEIEGEESTYDVLFPHLKMYSRDQGYSALCHPDPGRGPCAIPLRERVAMQLHQMADVGQTDSHTRRPRDAGSFLCCASGPPWRPVSLSHPTRNSAAKIDNKSGDWQHSLSVSQAGRQWLVSGLGPLPTMELSPMPCKGCRGTM